MKTSSSSFFSMRDPAPNVDSSFVERWSPRSFLSELVPIEHLTAIFDAARWSPSSYNEQPWRFFTATRDNKIFEDFLSCLMPQNQVWAKQAPVLGFVTTNLVSGFNGQPNRFAAFDAGAAWMALTFQAQKLGYHTHGMGGIVVEKVTSLLKLDPNKELVLCGFVLGKIGPASALPPEHQMNEKPSPRKPLKEIWKPNPSLP